MRSRLETGTRAGAYPIAATRRWLAVGGVLVFLLACLVGVAHAAPILAPTDIAGCQLWLDASDSATLWTNTGGTNPVASAGDLVARWDDKSGNSYPVTQGDSGRQPAYEPNTLGGNSALYFDSDKMDRANSLGISGNDDRTVITVWTDATGNGANYQHTFHMGDRTTNEAYGQSVSRGSNTGIIGNHYYGSGYDTPSTAGLGAPDRR